MGVSSDGSNWMRAYQAHRNERGRPRRLRGRRALCAYVAALALIIVVLFIPGLVAELRLRSLQRPAVLGPLVVQPTEVQGVSLYQVVGSRPPIYFGEGVPLGKVEWAREGVQIAWHEAPRITGLRQPGDEVPLFLFADHDQYVMLGRQLWGQRFGQRGWETCVFIGGLAMLRGKNGTVCDVGDVDSRAALSSALAHELTHQLINAEWMRGSSVPLWLNEGLATYVENEVYAASFPGMEVLGIGSSNALLGIGSANYVAHALRFKRYQRLHQLRWQTSDEQYVSYAYAHSTLAVSSLVERFGMNAVADLVRRSGPRSFEDTFADVLGITLVDFEAELEQSLRGSLLVPGRVLYEDDFAQVSWRWRRSWTERAGDNPASEYGEYALQVTGGSSTTRAVWNPLPFGDFQLAIDARLVEPVEDAAVFLDFRIHDGSDNGYRFSVDPSGGRFSLQYIRSAGESPLIDLTPSPAIHGPAATNHLGVRAQGAAIVLLVNGEEVGRAEASRLREGRIGFGVASPNGEPVEARFSNLLVTSVGD